MGACSADEIRQAVERAQRAAETDPTDQIYVDGDEIVGYPEVLNRDPETITQIPQGQRWAWRSPDVAPPIGAMSRHLTENRLRDRRIRLRFPGESYAREVDGIPGWEYAFTTPQGDRYVMFIYWDPDTTQYKVMLKHPEGEKIPKSAHDKHLFANGVLCLNLPREEQLSVLLTYSASRLWAVGFSNLIRTGEFIGKHA